MTTPKRHRILTIDDNPAIHEDFRKLFAGQRQTSVEFDRLESAVLGGTSHFSLAQPFELESANQGQEGLEKVKAAMAADRPFALAFVDVRMPPGWDGLETIEQLWKVDPELQVVICTAYSDHSWDDIRKFLGNSDGLLVLKKPFDAIEALQIAHTLTRKWELSRQVRASIQDLDRKVAERTEALENEMAQRVRIEENLRQAQKMEAVGQLAAGVAHDFNNLLTVIRGHADLLLSRTGAAAADSIKKIARAADRGAGLTRQLLVFSRKEIVRCKPMDLNQALMETGNLLRRVVGEQIELRLDPTSMPACVVADQGNIDQVIMNLVVNARDAMPDGGVLTLRTAFEILDEESAQRHPQARPGSFISLTVTDTGCGMDTATLNRIFEPFFTTKEVGKGTGLGLATVYGIAQQHQGWVEVTSSPGCGTTFKVFLPQREYDVSSSAGSPAGHTKFFVRPSPEAASQTTILVVEDEPGVREFVRTVLTMNSYRVLEAEDGLGALKLWAQHHSEIKLLFTDMVMPNGLSGRGLAEKLLAERPELKVIYASGYSAETIGAEWLHSPDIEFLQKPYTGAAILRSVAASLALPAPAMHHGC